MKYATVRDLKKAKESDAKARELFDAKIEKTKCEIKAQLEDLKLKVAEAQRSADYDQYEALMKQVESLNSKLAFYDGSQYVSSINDNDLVSSWVSVRKDYEDRRAKIYQKFVSSLDTAIEIYREYCAVYSEEIGAQWEFFNALDRSKFNRLGLPMVDFPDMSTNDIMDDFSLRHRMEVKNQDNGAGYSQLFNVINNKIPF